MNNSTVRKAIKSVVSERKLNKLGRTTGFTKRQRDVCAFNMVNALIAAMGDGQTECLADIQRMFNALSGHSLDYKPFHNQLRKAELSELMRQVFEQAMTRWVSQWYSLDKSKQVPFDSIWLHDGSSFAVKDELSDDYPGRFNETSPAAVECHLTLDLIHNSVEALSIAADTVSERHFAPDPRQLSSVLLLADAGYFSADYLNRIDAEGGFFIIRGLQSMNPTVRTGECADGRSLTPEQACPLTVFKKQLPSRESFELDVEWHGNRYRLIGFWIPSEKRFSWVLTNLPETLSMTDIEPLYRLRWQVELFFKECKSHNNLKRFGTADPNIVETLIWASMCAVTLKRLIAKSSERCHGVWISTLKAAKTIHGWWYQLFHSIVGQSQRRILTAIHNAKEVLRINARVAHPERDKKTGKYQYLIKPDLGEQSLGEA